MLKGASMQMHTDFLPAERLEKDKIIQQYNDLLNSQEFNKELIDKIPFIILILNSYRQVVFANKYFRDFTGLKTITEYIGKRPGEIFECNYSDINPGGCGTSKFCNQCGAANAILSSLKKIPDIRECTILLKTGNSLNFQVCAEPYEFNKENYTVFTIQDISDKLERESLENMFFGRLKNSIIEIKLISQLLRQNMEDTEFAERIETLTEKILEEIFFKKLIIEAENYKLKINPVKIHSNELIGEIIEKLSNSIDVNIDKNSEHVEFTTDYYLISNVIEQMLKYALVAYNIKENISISSIGKDNSVFFIVKFSKFIPIKNQFKMFQKSFSIEDNDINIRTYLIRLITTRYLKGSISVESFENIGTTFTIKLPINF